MNRIKNSKLIEIMKLLTRISLNFLIGAVLVIIWLQFVDLSQVIKVLKTVELKYTLLFFVFLLTSGFLHSLRLKILLNQYKIPLKKLFYLNSLSQLLSYMIPIRLGELSKSVYLNTHYSLPLSKTIVWIFIDRFLDLWTALLIITLLLLIIPTKLPPNFQLLVFICFLLFSLVPIIIIKSRTFAKKLFTLISKIFILEKPKSLFLNMIYSIIDGFTILEKHPLELLSVFIITILSAISDSFTIYFVLISLGIKLELVQNLLGSLLTALTFLIPAAPGYIGSAEAAGLAIYSGFLGLDPNVASATAVLNHILTTIALLIFGLISFYLLKFDLNLVIKKILRKS